MKPATRIAAFVCIVLGVMLPVSAATASAATPRSGTSTRAAQQAPVRCNQARTGNVGAKTTGSGGVVRCAIRIIPQPAKAAVPNASTADPAADDKIDFCNTTGGIIGCFNAMLHFVSATEFQLYDIEVSDDLNDGRSVYADVDTQAVDFGTFGNTDGSGTTAYDDTSTYDFTDSLDGVQYVYIDLYACGSILSGCSSDTYSTAQDNPDAGTIATRPAAVPRAQAGHPHPYPSTIRPLNAHWRLRAMTAAERNDVRLDAEASAIQHLVASDRLSGYGGLIVNAARDFLTVYWKGQVPAALRGYASEKHPAGAIRFSAARYTQAELDSVRAKIISSLGFRQSGITTLATAPDGSSLEIGVNASTAQAQSLPAIKQSPARVTFSRTPGVLLSGRWADISPFFGGAIITPLVSIVGDCSSGWPVHAKASLTTFYMITAAHCTYPANGAWTTSPNTGYPSRPVGTATSQDLTQDAALIDLGVDGSVGGGGGSAIYTGGVDPTGNGYLEMTAGVDGTVTNEPGDPVCTSGAYSGEICNLTIEDTGVLESVTYADGTQVLIPMLQIENPNLTNAAGQGDSGGPVYSYVNAGLVAARGTITKGDPDTETVCTGVLFVGNNTNQPRQCYWTIFAPDINQTLVSPFLPPIALNNEP
jgi:hypothetical protein